MKVLITGDDLFLADDVSRYLRHTGCLVDVASSATQADTLIADGSYDFVILDIALPGFQGFETLRRIRRRERYLPVLMLSAPDALEDRVHGLELGADDYLIKPIDLVELGTRISTVMRRGEKSNGTRLVYGELVLDIGARRAWLSEEPLWLTLSEWGVLEFLVLRGGKVASKDQIVSAVRRGGQEMSDNAVEVHISRLRSKLAAADLKIHSIRGIGYHLGK
jgi:DNA-binding response OmpR family regulator